MLRLDTNGQALACLFAA